MYPSEPFPHFVDDYLAYLHEILPSQAGLDGVHVHDDLLEDLSRSAIDAHVRALAGFGRRLHQIDPAPLSPVEQVEHPIVAANIEARMYELEVVRTWDRNPQVYSEIIGTSLAGQALFAYAPEAERARRVVSKLRQVPRLVQAAQDNIKDCPGIFVKVGLETWRGVLRFIESDLPRAFASLDDLHILGDLADTSTEAAGAIKAYIDYLETDLAPRAKASFRLGKERFEQKLKLEDGVTLSHERLLPIALRELAAVQEEFRSVAGRLNGGDPLDAWRRAKEQHPEPGKLLAVAKEQVKELEEFLRSQSIVVAAGLRAGRRRTHAGFLPVGVREHVDAGAVRDQAKPRLLLPDRSRSRLAVRPAEGAHAGFQHPDALEHLDSRGVSRPLPALPASAPRRVEGPQVDALRAGRRSSKAGRTTASR